MNFLSKIKPLRSTLLVSTLVTLLVMSRHAGFMLIFVMIPLVPWLAYSLSIIISSPKTRVLQAPKMTIWITATAIIIASHCYLYVSTRQYAQEIVNTLNSYAEKNGRYPANLAVIGVNTEPMRAKLGLSGYFIEEGKPHFVYSSTYVPFGREYYDFESREWRHKAD